LYDGHHADNIGAVSEEGISMQRDMEPFAVCRW
jgi:hypothetical protein